MTRTAATAYVRLHAATDASPALTAEELDLVLDECRCVDKTGTAPDADGYTDTIWATRAVVRALDTRLLKATHLVDFSVDGSAVSQSQVIRNIEEARKRAAALMVWGSV